MLHAALVLTLLLLEGPGRAEAARKVTRQHHGQTATKASSSIETPPVANASGHPTTLLSPKSLLPGGVVLATERVVMIWTDLITPNQIFAMLLVCGIFLGGLLIGYNFAQRLPAIEQQLRGPDNLCVRPRTSTSVSKDRFLANDLQDMTWVGSAVDVSPSGRKSRIAPPGERFEDMTEEQDMTVDANFSGRVSNLAVSGQRSEDMTVVGSARDANLSGRKSHLAPR